MPKPNQICYVEYYAKDLEATKRFFASVFDWKFTDYGSDYTCCGDASFGVGFARGERRNRLETGGAATVIFTTELEKMQEAVARSGGTITQEIFAFPGGRRFHFTEPSGNELAVCDIVE